MYLTSKEANKILKQYETELNSLLRQEENASTFLASVGEDVESCRPDYDYKETQNKLLELENKIIHLKHQINLFNSSTIVEGFDMTIDSMLIYIPQLTRRKNKLETMISTPPKAREGMGLRSTIIDYRYTNYDVNDALEDYNKVSSELTKAQIALDKVNVNQKFDFDL